MAKKQINTQSVTQNNTRCFLHSPTKGEEVAFIEKSIGHGESLKGMGYFEEKSLIVKCRNCVQSRILDSIYA